MQRRLRLRNTHYHKAALEAGIAGWGLVIAVNHSIVVRVASIEIEVVHESLE